VTHFACLLDLLTESVDVVGFVVGTIGEVRMGMGVGGGGWGTVC